MRDRNKELSEQKARQQKADRKVRDQEDVVRKINGTAAKHPEEQQLLNEMRGNKATLDFNQAMLDYDEEHRQQERRRDPLGEDSIRSDQSDDNIKS